MAYPCSPDFGRRPPVPCWRPVWHRKLLRRFCRARCCGDSLRLSHFGRRTTRYVTSRPGQLSLVPSVGWGKEYRPQCADAMRLGNKDRHGSVHLWNAHVDDRWSSLTRAIPERFRGIGFLSIKRYTNVLFTLMSNVKTAALIVLQWILFSVPVTVLRMYWSIWNKGTYTRNVPYVELWTLPFSGRFAAWKVLLTQVLQCSVLWVVCVCAENRLCLG